MEPHQPGAEHICAYWKVADHTIANSSTSLLDLFTTVRAAAQLRLTSHLTHPQNPPITSPVSTVAQHSSSTSSSDTVLPFGFRSATLACQRTTNAIL